MIIDFFRRIRINSWYLFNILYLFYIQCMTQRGDKRANVSLLSVNCSGLYLNWFKKRMHIQYLVVCKSNSLLSTIDGNVVFVHSQYSCILQLSFVSDKIISNHDNFRIKSLSYSKKCNFMVLLIFCFYTFLRNLKKHVQ